MTWLVGAKALTPAMDAVNKRVSFIIVLFYYWSIDVVTVLTAVGRLLLLLDNSSCLLACVQHFFEVWKNDERKLG